MDESRAITINFEYALTIALGISIITGLIIVSNAGLDQRKENEQVTNMNTITEKTASTIQNIESHTKDVKSGGGTIDEYKQRVDIPDQLESNQQVVTLIPTASGAELQSRSTNVENDVVVIKTLPDDVNVGDTTTVPVGDIWVVYDGSEDEYTLETMD